MVRIRSLFVTSMVASIAIGGCSESTGGPAEMGEMKAPPRPAELDMLDMFVGNWTTEGEMKMPGEPEVMISTGTISYEWTLDKKYLVEKWSMKMDEMEMEASGYWTWDAKAGKYKIWWFDSFGTWATGSSSYDATTKTWSMNSKGTNPMDGKPSWGGGSVKFPDANTMEGTWTEWDNVLKWGDAMEMTFKSTRK
ncbi:MAG: DUF1579 family protein [Planctomycetota bacterium]|nr:DUF1579 family protein [Planctomycetota bacterium]